ncbi:MAG: M48 family metalloprotease, partial [Methylococcales bacterium]
MFKPSAIALALSLALFPVLPQAVEVNKLELPEMGDSSGSLLTIAEEKELGIEFFRYLHSELTIGQDAEIQEYIQTIGNKLATNSDTPGYPFHFFVVMENDINAFAGPGGYIGVNSGLILMTEAESELASVMAHEIAHVTQRHLYRGVEAQQRLSIPTMA